MTSQLATTTRAPRLPGGRSDWLTDPRTNLLSGLVVALALIPEAISFSIIAGVDPKVGLYASFSIAIIISFAGGRPGMISAATGAMALVVVPLVDEYGIEYLFAATVLAGVLQIGFGHLGVGGLMRFIPRTVMVGFVNALAILIFLAQVPHILLNGDDADSQRSFWLNLAFIAVGLAIIYGLPRITKAVPSPLVAIVVARRRRRCVCDLACRRSATWANCRRRCRSFGLPGRAVRVRDAAHPRAVRDHARARRPARIAAHRTAARRPDRHATPTRTSRRAARASPTSPPASSVAWPAAP